MFIIKRDFRRLARSFVALAGLSLLLGACARPAANDYPALPLSWVDAAGAHASRGTPLDQPPAETSSAVRAAFRAHSTAASLASRRASPNSVEELPPPGAPKDWVPWHLDGMIASFGVDVGGVFGTVAGNGSVGLRVTWQQKRKQSKPIPPPSTEQTLKFNSRMTRKDVARMIEPALKTARATKSVDDIEALREHLTTEGLKFLSVAKVLDSIAGPKGWHVAGYRLALTFNASGSVGPSVGAGGGGQLIFDWSQEYKNSGVNQGSLNPTEKILLENLTGFIDSLASLIPEAQAQAGDIRKAGFELQSFQVGLGISAGGSVGVASVKGQAVGRIIFKKDTAPVTRNPSQPTTNQQPRQKKLKIFDNQEGSADHEVAIEDFRSGLSRAIDMSSFFARNAVGADTDSWRVVQIQVGFDSSVTGDFTVVTVGGNGLIRLGFDRIN